MNGRSTWVENAIVYGGLFLAYLKTSEAMVAYGPRAVMGYSAPWISGLWAYMAGALVEGVLFVTYLKLKERGKDKPTKVLSAIVALVSLAFSVTMNRIDQAINDGTISTIGPDSPIAFLHGVVFLIPLAAAVAYMLISIVDNNTPDRGGGRGYNPPQRPDSFRRHEPAAQWHGGAPVDRQLAGEMQPLLRSGSGPGEAEMEEERHIPVMQSKADRAQAKFNGVQR